MWYCVNHLAQHVLLASSCFTIDFRAKIWDFKFPILDVIFLDLFKLNSNINIFHSEFDLIICLLVNVMCRARDYISPMTRRQLGCTLLPLEIFLATGINDFLVYF